MPERDTRGPLALPPGTRLRDVSVRGLALSAPGPVPVGAVLELELMLGARPVPVMARVTACEAEPGGSHRVQADFVALAQVDRDTIADVLQAMGRDALSVRPPARE